MVTIVAMIPIITMVTMGTAFLVVLLSLHQFICVPYCYYRLYKIKQYIFRVHIGLYHNQSSNCQVETFGHMDRGTAMPIPVCILFLHVVQRMYV